MMSIKRAYLEDVDLFLTFKENSYAFGVDVGSEVVHNHLTTSSTKKGFKEKQDLKNWIRIGKKHSSIQISPSFIIERGRNLSGILKVS